ncbi:hypothetical protein SAMN04489740_4281 [Arthrobacter alpinus]|uniref:Uncharacterized protein n=1 Tax=Arthrobacter alpinus TaxID=656366 RepID=A0A1H5PGA0_9MICC|nr:hypothetical protein [Arthrobacter alpinus]SEF12736.1 hypothetical protein SAMN04489740_4281 [Arthrobacter alpinus]
MKNASFRQRLFSIILACGILLGLSVAVAPASSATPAGFTAYAKVSSNACYYWKDQYAKKGYLTLPCHQFPNGDWSFDYKRQLA